MKKIISLLSALVISVVSFAGISNADSKKPIVIPTHNWSSSNCNGLCYWWNFRKHG